MDDVRKAVSELRRWCTHSETHMDVEDGGSCEACYDCDECSAMRHSWQREHRARIRRMLVCSVCEMGFFNRPAFEAHECHSAY